MSNLAGFGLKSAKESSFSHVTVNTYNFHWDQ